MKGTEFDRPTTPVNIILNTLTSKIGRVNDESILSKNVIDILDMPSSLSMHKKKPDSIKISNALKRLQLVNGNAVVVKGSDDVKIKTNVKKEVKKNVLLGLPINLKRFSSSDSSYKSREEDILAIDILSLGGSFDPIESFENRENIRVRRANNKSFDFDDISVGEGSKNIRSQEMVSLLLLLLLIIYYV